MKKFNLSSFTKSYIDIFKNDKYMIKDDNNLMNYIINEKKNIISFMKNNTYKININKINKNKIINKFKKLTMSKWVLQKKVNEYINNFNNVYHIEWNNNNIYVICDEFEYLKERFIILIYMIEYIKTKSKLNKKYNIYIVLTDLLKTFPNEKEIIDVKHVNSGYTYLIKNFIFIWRYEEFEKVLFHEAIHYAYFLNNLININHELHIIGPTSYFEALTDLYAIIYNCIYISLMTKKSIKDILMIELSFIRNQAIILNKYFDDKKQIIQKTPAYSYYIIKYMLFDYLIKNNKIPTEINDDLITKSINKDIVVNNKYVNLESLRMTLFELETK